MPLHRRSVLTAFANPLTFGLAAVLTLATPRPAPAQTDICAARQAWLDAAETARKAQDEFRAAPEPPIIAKDFEAALDDLKVTNIVDLIRQTNFDDTRITEALIRKYTKLADGGNKAAAALVPDLKKWLEVRKKREAALEDLAKAQQAYLKASEKAAKDLEAARKEFEAEQKWISEQKAALAGQSADNPETLRDIQKLLDHARAKYDKLKTDLAANTCDVETARFLADLENRLRRIGAIEKIVAEKNGGAKPDTTTADAGTAASTGSTGSSTSDKPLGDVYVARVELNPSEKCTATDGAIEYTLENSEGTPTCKITWTGIPKRIRVNEQINLTISAGGPEKSYGAAAFKLNNVQASPHEGKGRAGTFGSGYDRSETLSWTFGPGQNAYIRVEGGRYNDPDGKHSAYVTYRYVKEGE